MIKEWIKNEWRMNGWSINEPQMNMIKEMNA